MVFLLQENADLNIEGLEDCDMRSAEEAYEFQLQSKPSSREKEQEYIWFDLISFEVFKIRCFEVKKITLFGSNKKSISFLSPPWHKPTWI